MINYSATKNHALQQIRRTLRFYIELSKNYRNPTSLESKPLTWKQQWDCSKAGLQNSTLCKPRFTYIIFYDSGTKQLRSTNAVDSMKYQHKQVINMSYW